MESGMKRYGAIRKLMLIVLLSILGSYCIGTDCQQVESIDSIHTIMKSTYGAVVSIVSYCGKLGSELLNWMINLLYRGQEQNIIIQSVGANQYAQQYCTDGKKDCKYNEEFFDDTWFSGHLDMDPNSHIDADVSPMRFIHD